MALFPKSVLCLFLALFMSILCFSHAFILEVGGSKGWTLNPTENYSDWAHRLRFSVNDTLHFKYNAATDSVLVVSKDNYDSCNSNSPITKLDGGDSSFTFDRSGSFFFITGNKSNCDQGQKIHIIVLAIRNNQSPPSANSPAPAADAPTTASPSPSAADISPAPVTGISPAPGSSGTNPAPAAAPNTASPAPSAADISPAPVTGISPAPPGTSGTNPADGGSAAAQGPAGSSARATFNADSTVPFVMILSLAFAWFVC